MKVNKYINLQFELRAMGMTFFAPFAIYLYFLFVLHTGEFGFEIKLFKLIEYTLVPVSGWWIVLLYYDYYEEGLEQLLNSYPLIIWKQELVRVHYFLIFHLLLFVSCIVLLSIVLDVSIFPLFVQYVPETLLFAYVSYFLIVITKNFFVTLIAVIGYVSTEVITTGQVIPWYHVMFFNTSPLPIESIVDKSILTSVLCVLFLTTTQIILKYRFR